ncbi:hypothetical protein H8D36_06755 [archaeon]|nr:hypothetical protein [archaeon]
MKIEINEQDLVDDLLQTQTEMWNKLFIGAIGSIFIVVLCASMIISYREYFEFIVMVSLILLALTVYFTFMAINEKQKLLKEGITKKRKGVELNNDTKTKEKQEEVASATEEGKEEAEAET